MYDRHDKIKNRVENMKDVLDRFEGGDYKTDKAGDGNQILRWARLGYLTVNIEKMEKDNEA